MPAPLSTALLAFGAIVTNLDVPAGVSVAGAGVLFELWRFYNGGLG